MKSKGEQTNPIRRQTTNVVHRVLILTKETVKP